jgi:carboxyl-terminal processing protease
MLPASIIGPSGRVGFPDPCLTPMGPVPVLIPYPNLAMDAMGIPTCPTILLMMMPAVNQATIVPMTLGDQAGVLSPFMGPGIVAMGIPIVLLQGMPAVTLACPTTGNNMINPIGIVAIPGAPTIVYCYAAPAETVKDLLFSDGGVDAGFVAPGVGCVRIRAFSRGAPAAVHAAVSRLAQDGLERLVFDVRGNPGGELLSAVEIVRDLLPEGEIVATIVDVDGDEIDYRARGDAYPWPLVVQVDEKTASAAELFAGSLKAHGRAVVVGRRTYGKGSARTIVSGSFVDAGCFHLPGGDAVEGVGVLPDREDVPAGWS